MVKKVRIKNSCRIVFTLMCLLLPIIASAKVTVTADRNVIEEGETFQLIISSDQGEPDTKVISRDFNILGSAKSSKVSIVNGSMSRVNELILRLSAKRVGTFEIPAIKAGNDLSAPFSIKVIPASFAQTKQGADIFLEAKADLLSAYVQSQIVYTIRLYRAVEIREGSLTEPDLSDAVVERLGEDVTFQTRREGRLYHVTERKFAIFPQKSGEFTIAPTIFQGQAVDNTVRQRSNDPFDRFFQNQRTKRVRVKSEAVEVSVDPEPEEAKGDVWLPAKRLTLLESWWPESPEFKVGEPVTRTLRIEAHGLTAAQLPELKSFDTNGIKQYADQPVVETVLQQGELIGVREEKFAIVPTESGKLILPEIRLYWWDTELNRQAYVSIPPKVIEVERGAEVRSQGVEPQNDELSQKNAKEEDEQVLKTVLEAGYWPMLAFIAAIGWALTLVGWLFYWRKKRLRPESIIAQEKNQDSVSLGVAKKQLKQACDNNDPAGAKQALLHWANAAWPGVVSPSLSFLLERFREPSLSAPLNALNQALYAEDNTTWDGAAFWLLVKDHLTVAKIKSKKTEKLPGLYPQKG